MSQSEVLAVGNPRIPEMCKQQEGRGITEDGISAIIVCNGLELLKGRFRQVLGKCL